MSIRSYFKKKGKRIAGSWGRINHKKQMRAASKGVRRHKLEQQKINYNTRHEKMLDTAFSVDDHNDEIFDLITDEQYHI